MSLQVRDGMLDWLKRWGARPVEVTHDRTPPVRRPGKMSGAYLSLHTYLDNRYADVVVLTFGQIEDLLGFALPDRARTNRDWWTATDGGDPSPNSNAWTLAGRSACPNLEAQTVVFERC